MQDQVYTFIHSFIGCSETQKEDVPLFHLGLRMLPPLATAAFFFLFIYTKNWPLLSTHNQKAIRWEESKTSRGPSNKQEKNFRPQICLISRCKQCMARGPYPYIQQRGNALRNAELELLPTQDGEFPLSSHRKAFYASFYRNGQFSCYVNEQTLFQGEAKSANKTRIESRACIDSPMSGLIVACAWF